MIVKPNIDTALTVALAPVLAAQTVWVKKRALQLPEPVGPRYGSAGRGAPFRLLVLGDSSAAGVGVQTQSQALAPQLAARLGLTRRIDWTLAARNGATTADVPDLLAPLKGTRFDLAYVIFGVNDAKNLRPETAWRRDTARAVEMLRNELTTRHVVFSGLPPVRDFPLLPHPLKSVLALRAARFDRALRQVTSQFEDCHHLPTDPRLDPMGMAEDGFHPGPAIYSHWADMAAQGLAPFLR